MNVFVLVLHSLSLSFTGNYCEFSSNFKQISTILIIGFYIACICVCVCVCSLYQQLQQKSCARSKLITEAVKYTPAVVNKLKCIWISNKPSYITIHRKLFITEHQAVLLQRNESY